MEKHYPLLESIKLPSDIKKLNHDELETLAEETREVIIDSVSKNGGHLAPSLGVVELTIALMRVCDPLDDRIIWDVGHQSYPFKILTDRLSRFQTLRTFGGISGFNNIFESPYDAFGVGHSSTSISAGFGIASADKIMGRERKVVAIIGDGALSGGMAFEGLNNLGSSDTPMVVVLNDNEMSISKNVGALSSSLSRMITGEMGSAFRRDVRSFLNSNPLGRKIKGIARRFEESTISFFTPGILFEELGLRYIGPIDGHKVKDIEKALNSAFAYNCPVLVHVITRKGKGYAPAEQSPGKFHGVSCFAVETGKPQKFENGTTWTQAFGSKLTEMAENNDKIVAVTAAMCDGTGLKNFMEKFPERFFDVGIAEEHAVTFAAGLAVTGLRPYVAIYSTFLQRAIDQIIHDVALQKLPVCFCIDRAGLVGQDGATHHGAFDISYLRFIPNVAMFLPRDIIEFEQMLELTATWNGPVAVRYARGVSDCCEDVPRREIIPGEAEIIYDEGEYAIVSAGHIFPEALAFHQKLEAEGYKSKLINLRFIKPLDMDKLMAHLDVRAVYTFEENVRTGGAGEMIELAVRRKHKDTSVFIFSLPDEFVTHGNNDELRKFAGLTADAAWDTFQRELQNIKNVL